MTDPRTWQQADDLGQGSYLEFLTGTPFSNQQLDQPPVIKLPPTKGGTPLPFPLIQGEEPRYVFGSLQLAIAGGASTLDAWWPGEIQIEILEGQLQVSVSGIPDDAVNDPSIEVGLRVRRFIPDAGNGTYSWDEERPREFTGDIDLNVGDRLVLTRYTHLIRNAIQDGKTLFNVIRHGINIEDIGGCNPCLRYPP